MSINQHTSYVSSCYHRSLFIFFFYFLLYQRNKYNTHPPYIINSQFSTTNLFLCPSAQTQNPSQEKNYFILEIIIIISSSGVVVEFELMNENGWG